MEINSSNNENTDNSLDKILKSIKRVTPIDVEKNEILLLNIEQASLFAKVSRQTIYSWIREKKLNFYFGAIKLNKDGEVNLKTLQQTGWINPLEINHILDEENKERETKIEKSLIDYIGCLAKDKNLNIKISFNEDDGEFVSEIFYKETLKVKIINSEKKDILIDTIDKIKKISIKK